MNGDARRLGQLKAAPAGSCSGHEEELVPDGILARLALGPGGRTAAAAALLTGKRHNIGINGGSGLLRWRARLASEELDQLGSAECGKRNVGSSQHGRKK
jgi:hypothetical protein